MQKKLLLVTDFESNGGTKTYFYNLIKFLDKSNYKIYVYLKTNSTLTNLEIKNLSQKYNIKFFPQYYTHENIIKYKLLFIFYRLIFCITFAFKFV